MNDENAGGDLEHPDDISVFFALTQNS